jgi:TPR repeat protein
MHSGDEPRREVSRLERAAASGAPPDRLRLALAVSAEDPLRARRLVEEVAGEGSVVAMLWLVSRYQETASQRSESWLETAAAAGDCGAMLRLGALRLKAGDHSAAMRLFEASAEAGSTRAMVLIGTILNAEGDKAGLLQWLRRAAQAGDTEAMRILGLTLIRDQRTAEGETWLRQAIEGGDDRAVAGLARSLRFRRPLEALRLACRAGTAAPSIRAAWTLGWHSYGWRPHTPAGRPTVKKGGTTS